MNCFETMFQMEPYVFCDENLSDYEKTIYILAIAYGASPIYRLSKKDIEELSLWLEVDFKLLAKALENEMNFPCGNAIIKFGDDTIECGEYFKNDFFDVIVKLLFAYKNLEEIYDDFGNEAVGENIQTSFTINHYFEMANAIAATYECMHENAFSYDNTMYDSAECFYPKNDIEMLSLLAISADCLGYDEDLINILTKLLKYEFKTRINALYLVTICQIFKHSPCFTREMKNIATDIYNKLLLILKNGKVVSMIINCLHRKTDKQVDERSKKDNTTRMQILYGYPNYDCYDLRFDFSHKGQEVVHFNNETPGGLSCCIFNKNEYQNIIDQYPELKDCFISYDDRWALKERINCELTDDMKVSFDRVRKEKAHDPIFTQSYLETDINDFINLVSKMLPKECRRAIDVGGTYAKLCFNYDVIMRDTTLLYLVYLARDSKRVDMVAEWISDKAFRYGLTSERINIDTLGQVLEIIKTAESRI